MDLDYPTLNDLRTDFERENQDEPFTQAYQDAVNVEALVLFVTEMEKISV